MTSRFISYAQNFEDVMLWRALKNHPPGAYVDVGANDPVIDSVTKAFYDRGWRGINIDAVPEFVERLRSGRPDEVNHGFFVGARESITDFYQVGDTGLSTYRKDYAESYQNAGHEISKLQVETRTLTSILRESGITNERFHFLKVDVEGAEADVLLGLDLEQFRPWIIVIEATEPNSTNLSLDYESRLLSHRYSLAYFDGLSRYYVAEERAGLIEAFQSPPCVFDEFDRWETVQAREATLTAEAYAGTLDDRLSATREELSETLEKLTGVTEALDDVRKLIAFKDSHIHSLHAAMIQFERRASSLHSSFTADFDLAGNGLSKALKKLYSSVLWKRGALFARLFRSKSPRGQLNEAAAFVTRSSTKHERALKQFRDDILRAIDVPAQSAGRRRLGKSAAAIADLIQAGYSGKSRKP
jgi:FkbM family methyltransferase